MQANLVAFLSLILSIAAFALSYGWLQKQSTKVRLACLVLFSFLSIPSLLFASYYLHIVPEQAWFYELHSWRGAEFLLIFFGCATASLASFLSRILVAFPLFALLAVGTIPYLKPLLAPLPDESLGDHWKDSACLQSTSSTCGPASVCTILKSLGIPATESQAARACFSYGGGTEAWYLARYLRQKGVKAHFDFRDTFMPAVGLPALVGVRMGGVGHFIAVLSVQGDLVKFADPLVGEETLTMDQFRKRYKFTGFHMSVAQQ